MKRIKINKKKLLVFAVIILILSVFLAFENNALQITYYTYKTDKISEKYDGFKIVQISDLHNKKMGKNGEKLADRISECEPDIIVLTGDLVDSNHTDIEYSLNFCKEIKEFAPVYYITGNHEKWLSDGDYKKLMNGLSENAVTILDNDFVKLDEENITIIGLDDDSLNSFTLNKVIENADKESMMLLLAHEPQFWDEYNTCDIDLVLSGHAHGGQFRIPFTHKGIIAPDQSFLPEYTEGVFEKNGKTLIISRGIGNSVIPFRLFNRPEIVCVTLDVQ